MTTIYMNPRINNKGQLKPNIVMNKLSFSHNLTYTQGWELTKEFTYVILDTLKTAQASTLASAINLLEFLVQHNTYISPQTSKSSKNFNTGPKLVKLVPKRP